MLYKNIWQQDARGAEDQTYSKNLPNIYCTKIKTFERTFSSNHVPSTALVLITIDTQKAHSRIKWPSPGERTNPILFEWFTSELFSDYSIIIINLNKDND